MTAIRCQRSFDEHGGMRCDTVPILSRRGAYPSLTLDVAPTKSQRNDAKRQSYSKKDVLVAPLTRPVLAA
jgi:hypothetical protein